MGVLVGSPRREPHSVTLTIVPIGSVPKGGAMFSLHPKVRWYLAMPTVFLALCLMALADLIVGRPIFEDMLEQGPLRNRGAR